MTKEEKQLLFKVLCAMLPYGVIVYIHDICDADDYNRQLIAEDLDLIELDRRNCKPYLRPLSSMTEEEERTLDSMCNGVEMVSRLSGLKMFDKAFDYLNAHHLDYCGLIPMGLALEAKEGMYKIE